MKKNELDNKNKTVTILFEKLIKICLLLLSVLENTRKPS